MSLFETSEAARRTVLDNADAQIAALEAAKVSAANDLAAAVAETRRVTSDLDAARTEIDDLQDTLHGQQQENADLHTTLATVQAQRTTLQAQVTTLTGQVTTLTAEVATLRARVAELDPFEFGVTMPQSATLGDPVTNVGRASVTEPLRQYTGPIPIVGSDDPVRPTVFAGYDFPLIATFASGHAHIDQSLLRGSNATGDSGLIDTRAAGVKHVKVTRSEFDPGQAGASHRLSGVIGHHLTLERNIFRRVVDAGNFYNEHGPELLCVVRGNLVEWLAHFSASTKGVVHPSDYETHNDDWQVQGGRYILIEGNRTTGRIFAPDGVTVPSNALPTNRAGQPWAGLSGQFAMIQQNVQPGVPIDPIVIRNWIGGGQNGIVARTRDYDKTPAGTAYVLEAWGNRVLDEQHRWYSTSGTDLYGTPGGKWYGLRLDNQVGLKRQDGSVWQPRTDHVEFAAGVATYADAPGIHTRRRGKDVPGRRDNYPGGKPLPT